MKVAAGGFAFGSGQGFFHSGKVDVGNFIAVNGDIGDLWKNDGQGWTYPCAGRAVVLAVGRRCDVYGFTGDGVNAEGAEADTLTATVTAVVINDGKPGRPGWRGDVAGNGISRYGGVRRWNGLRTNVLKLDLGNGSGHASPMQKPAGSTRAAGGDKKVGGIGHFTEGVGIIYRHFAKIGNNRDLPAVSDEFIMNFCNGVDGDAPPLGTGAEESAVLILDWHRKSSLKVGSITDMRCFRQCKRVSVGERGGKPDIDMDP